MVSFAAGGVRSHAPKAMVPGCHRANHRAAALTTLLLGDQATGLNEKSTDEVYLALGIFEGVLKLNQAATCLLDDGIQLMT